MEAKYSVGTWDSDKQAYTPQQGAGQSVNITWKSLLAVMRRLRDLGYSAHRVRNNEGDHYDNDTSVLVERTDGMTLESILKSWER